MSTMSWGSLIYSLGPVFGPLPQEEDNREENDVMHGLADSESDVDINSDSTSLPVDSDLESDNEDTPL